MKFKKAQVAGRGLLRRLAGRLGYEIHRTTPQRRLEENRLAMLLAARNIDWVLDVGACRGQFGSQLRRMGYRGHIVSFEPLAQEHAVLSGLAARDGKWIVAPPMAIGDHDGEVELQVTANRASSSILRVGEEHVRVAPNTHFSHTETVPLRRLDGLTGLFPSDGRLFLKADVQGAEDQVLRGAEGIMHRVDGWCLELSLVELYDGQTLLPGMLDLARDNGYDLHAIRPGFSDPETGRVLQADGVFFR